MGIGAHYLQFRYFFRDSIAEIESLARKGTKDFAKIKDALMEAVTFHNDVKEYVVVSIFHQHKNHNKFNNLIFVIILFAVFSP